MNVSITPMPEHISRECPVAAKLEQYGRHFGPAASDAKKLWNELLAALEGRANDIYLSDLNNADANLLKVAADNLEDLVSHAKIALSMVNAARSLRSNSAWHVEARLEQCRKNFEPAANDAMKLAGDLLAALEALAQDLARPDLKATDVHSIKADADKLDGILSHVRKALAVINAVRTFRSRFTSLEGVYPSRRPLV